MKGWSKITVGWFRVYNDPHHIGRPGTWKIIFFAGDAFPIPSKTAVVDDFGDLVEVPA